MVESPIDRGCLIPERHQSISEEKKMAKKSRKKVKKAQKKSPEEAKAEVVEILVAKCGKERDEVLEAWDQFHEQFPEGLIPKEDFLGSKKVNCRQYVLTHGWLSQNRMLAEALFKVFDDDNSGTFSFEEYYQVAGWLNNAQQ